MNKIVRGSLAGLIATVPMSAVIAAAKAAGLLETPPPKQITGTAQEKAGMNPTEMGKPAFRASWLAAHFGYGAGCGVAYSLLRPLLPGPRAVEGLLFGWLVWAASYLGLMPALRLYPNPKQDSTSRAAVMIFAHAVFGVALAESESRL